MRDLCFIDVETTGLIPHVNEIIEVSAIRTDPSNEKILDFYSSKVELRNPRHADAVALDINRYDIVVWAKEAYSKHTVLRDLFSVVDETTLVGSNVGFDRAFLQWEYIRWRHPLPDLPHRVIDIQALAWPFKLKGYIDSVSLASLADFFNIQCKPDHSSWKDVCAARQVYDELMKLWDSVI